MEIMLKLMQYQPDYASCDSNAHWIYDILRIYVKIVWYIMLNNVYILTESQCSSAKALFAAICLNLRNCFSSTGKMAKDGRAPSERMEAKITNCFVLASIFHPYFFWFYFCFALFCFFISPFFSLNFLFFSLVSIPHPLIFCLALFLF